MNAPAPLNLIAELTYRCPLQCPYCSNPVNLAAHRESLSAEDWGRVFDQSAELGVVHVGLTGGEPSVRTDLEEILARAVAADLYPHLVTAGLPLDADRLAELARIGLRSVQISIQDADAASSNRIAGTASFDQKIELCEKTHELGLALTINCVLHRHNLASVPAMLSLAKRLRADRLELANTQYHGWALKNRAALMPTREQLATASLAVREAAKDPSGLQVLFVLPDYYSDRPKPCMGGWGRLAIVVDPTGRLLPCHEAGTLPELDFWNVKERPVAECWLVSPGMQMYRGTDWMPEPCRSCPEKERDFGGCRCQAFRLLGNASLTDPACSLSADHDRIVGARSERSDSWEPRR
jgi:pyrroloquinoline quinone biosynthesis protein E